MAGDRCPFIIEHTRISIILYTGLHKYSRSKPATSLSDTMAEPEEGITPSVNPGSDEEAKGSSERTPSPDPMAGMFYEVVGSDSSLR